MKKDMERGKYKRLCPRVRDDGVIVVGGHTGKWMEMSYNKSEVPLLPYKHDFSRLYSKHIHQLGHHGVSTTTSKVRTRFWIVSLHKMAKSIKYNCVTCKKLDKKTTTQVMGRLPEERLKPAPAWNCTAVDLFGPFKIRDEVKKRTVGKAYGVIFNCLGTRAVHVDLAPDYSTEKFLLVLRRLVSMSIIHFNNPLQLLNRLELLAGSLIAGNNGVMQEFSQIAHLLHQVKVITKKQLNDLLKKYILNK